MESVDLSKEDGYTTEKIRQRIYSESDTYYDGIY